MKRNAWIALSLAPAFFVVGCNSEPVAIAPVPAPNYAASPEPLPPVSINEGATVAPEPGPGSVTLGPGAYEPEPLTPAQPVNRSYTIRKGDTLWSIAQREYGSGKKWKEISALNPSLDPKKLVIGQQIVLP